MEDRGAKEYQAYLKEVKARKEYEKQKIAESSLKDYKLRQQGHHNLTQESTIITSSHSPLGKRRHSETSLKLQQFERKMSKALKRQSVLRAEAVKGDREEMTQRLEEVKKA